MNLTATQRLTEDMKSALRAHESLRLDAVRFLLAQVRNAEIDTPDHRALTEDEFIKLVQKLLKSAREAIEQYRAGDREDLATEEEKKVAIWETYLPQQFSDAELTTLVQQVIAENPGKPLGPLMGMVLQKAAGKTDSARVMATLKQQLE